MKRTKVEDCDFSARVNNVIQGLSIQYLEELTEFTEKDLMEYRNFGKHCLNEVKRVLANHGLCLKEKKKEWISVKDRLPECGDIVLIKSKWYQPFLCTARFMESYICLDGDYKNIFIVLCTPKIATLTKNIPNYKKASIIKKSNVQEWMPIPGISMSQ